MRRRREWGKGEEKSGEREGRKRRGREWGKGEEEEKVRKRRR